MVESERFQVYRKGQVNKKEETRDKMRFLRSNWGGDLELGGALTQQERRKGWSMSPGSVWCRTGRLAGLTWYVWVT